MVPIKLKSLSFVWVQGQPTNVTLVDESGVPRYYEVAADALLNVTKLDDVPPRPRAVIELTVPDAAKSDAAP